MTHSRPRRHPPRFLLGQGRPCPPGRRLREAPHAALAEQRLRRQPHAEAPPAEQATKRGLSGEQAWDKSQNDPTPAGFLLESKKMSDIALCAACHQRTKK